MNVLPKLHVVRKANFRAVEFLGTTIMSRKKKKNSSSLVYILHIIRCEIKHCHIIVMQ